jgi:ribosome-binding protein aMBF1 (putative translation factor)
MTAMQTAHKKMTTSNLFVLFLFMFYFVYIMGSQLGPLLGPQLSPPLGQGPGSLHRPSISLGSLPGSHPKNRKETPPHQLNNLSQNSHKYSHTRLGNPPAMGLIMGTRGESMGKSDYESIKQIIGKNIKTYRREQKNISLHTLANQTNIDPNHLSRIERGKHLPNLLTFFKLIHVLDIPEAEYLPAIIEMKNSSEIHT